MVDKQTKIPILNARLAKNISARRRSLDLTQAQLAEKVGVDTETLSRFERGKHLPSLSTLERLAGELSIPMAALLDESPVPVATDAQRVSAWLQELGETDRPFVMKQMKQLCEHLKQK